MHTGLYIEERFPQFGVRYIAINDNVDTENAESNDLMPFKNLFNEWFVRDTSRKIRAVQRAKAQRGERLGTRAPYGYQKDENAKGKLIVDEERYMQARLEARDARYRQTLELLPEGVVILKGEDGVIEWVNTMAGVHLGITSEDVGSVFTDRLIASQPAFCAWLRSRDFSRHYALETAGGSVLLDAAVVAPDERHTIIVTHDVTERRRVDDMRRDFVANVSHELRTPLTVIAGFLDLRTWTCRPSSESAISPSCVTRRPA